MNESMDRVVADWLQEGPERGPRDGLERTLAATRRVGQRPGWALPERWLPMQLTMTRRTSQRPIFTIAALALLIVALVATALYIGSQWRLPRSPFGNGAVVWAAGGDLLIADQLDGTPRTLVAGPEADSDPVFSPQGERIAFVRGSRDDDVRLIMTVRPDGSDIAELAAVDSLFVALDWAPDGSVLLASGERRYEVYAGGSRSELGVGPDHRRLYVVKSDGSGSRLLDPGPGVIAGTGAWRPDGRHIAFIGWQEERHVADVYVADADGSNVRRLPTEPMTGWGELDDLEWSPDGTHLSISRADDGAKLSIADIDADGALAGVRRLTLDPGLTVDPTWSPDGSRLAYLLVQSSAARVAIVDADGSGHRLVGPTLAYQPVLEFTAPLWVLDTDGYFGHTDRSVRPLWPTSATDVTWSPDGRSVVVTGDTLISRRPPKSWLVDVATGEQTEVHTPVASWQRSVP
ncbi:MAG: TolB protein [Chloroflexota bacterium]|nr:TolB protein [Chloroflexota bacterium]